MTYNVFGGTLNLALSINLTAVQSANTRKWKALYLLVIHLAVCPFSIHCQLTAIKRDAVSLKSMPQIFVI